MQCIQCIVYACYLFQEYNKMISGQRIFFSAEIYFYIYKNLPNINHINVKKVQLQSVNETIIRIQTSFYQKSDLQLQDVEYRMSLGMFTPYVGEVGILLLR